MPVATAFGVDPVHFGVILILNLGIGLCTPPVGAVLFVGCAVGRIPIWDAVRSIWPFYGAAFATLVGLVLYGHLNPLDLKPKGPSKGPSDERAPLAWWRKLVTAVRTGY